MGKVQAEEVDAEGCAMKRGQVSVRAEVYELLRSAANERGTSISQIVEAAVLDTKVVDPPEEPPPAPPPREFVCALCVRYVNCVPVREPFGRRGALVNVCTKCANDRPRAW